MAEKRGGPRRPRDRTPTAPGIGRSSKRTDRQLIATPSVQESTDLQQGDRERIRQMQRAQPLSATPTPRVTPPAGGGLPAGAGGGVLPPHIFEIPTTRPEEPETAGLPFGSGGGPETLQSYQAPDDRELILRFLARGGNEDANRVLSGIADSKRPPEMVAPLSSAESIEREPILAEEEPEDLAAEKLPPEEPNIPQEAIPE